MLLAVCMSAGARPSLAQGPGRLVAIVNDEAISEYDLDQRVKMNAMLNDERGTKQQQRKKALEELIDNNLKRQEAKRLKLAVTEKDVDDSYASMSKRAGVSEEAWAQRLKKYGVAISTIKKEINASLSWRRVVQARFGRRIQVENNDIDREYQKLLKEPKPSRTFYVLRNVLLPMQQNAPQAVLNTRLRDAADIIRKFRGCNRIGQAVANKFGVKILGVQNVPVEALPAKMRQALDRAGPGRAVGPAPSRDGIIVIGYCSRKVIEAPDITRESVERQLLYRKFDRIGAQFLGDLKRDAVIEYKLEDLRS